LLSGRACRNLVNMTTNGRSKLRPTGLPALLSLQEVADATGLSERTIRRRISDGTFRAHRIGPRTIRIDRESVLKLLGTPLGAA
jgi:excisionase family DNA binding protein